jgi:hypothetical protein
MLPQIGALNDGDAYAARFGRKKEANTLVLTVVVKENSPCLNLLVVLSELPHSGRG